MAVMRKINPIASCTPAKALYNPSPGTCVGDEKLISIKVDWAIANGMTRARKHVKRRELLLILLSRS
jgi:hypothetical protein